MVPDVITFCFFLQPDSLISLLLNPRISRHSSIITLGIGLITITVMIKMPNYSKMKVVQLKYELVQRGAITSGKKADLIQRLQAYDYEANNNFLGKVVELPGGPPTTGFKQLTPESAMNRNEKFYLDLKNLIKNPSKTVETPIAADDEYGKSTNEVPKKRSPKKQPNESDEPKIGKRMMKTTRDYRATKKAKTMSELEEMIKLGSEIDEKRKLLAERKKLLTNLERKSNCVNCVNDDVPIEENKNIFCTIPPSFDNDDDFSHMPFPYLDID
uniref:SAP domain-containing protein n=1 Tax=Strigamia maritima TaxID=126957 RepID=T1IQE2_STRMM